MPVPVSELVCVTPPPDDVSPKSAAVTPVTGVSKVAVMSNVSPLTTVPVGPSAEENVAVGGSYLQYSQRQG